MKKTFLVRSQIGFTLIEIMIVIVILGVLGALVVPNLLPRVDQAKVEAAKSSIRSIESALLIYKLDNGHYPSNDQGLEALVEKPAGFPEPKRWMPEGYLGKLPLDPWDNPFLYYVERRDIDIVSYGADSQEGGEGVDKDIRLVDL